MADVEILRIIATPAVRSGNGPDMWRAALDGGPALCSRTRMPLLDGARALLAIGHDPDALVTLRLAGKAYDSFNAIKLAVAARLTTSETDAASIRFRRWKPYAGPARSADACDATGPISCAPAVALPGDARARVRADAP